ncbi:hypothetical protein ABFX02_13G078200 [Erythranthe guttata]
MAVRLLSYEVADLCLGKPPLRSLSSSATVADALSALKSSDDNFISVWSCNHSSSSTNRNLDCVCVGKVCMVDIICFLCRQDNLSSPSSALNSSVSVLLSKVNGLVRHVEPSSSLLEAIDLILDGAHNLVVPIKSNFRRKPLPRSQSSIIPTTHNHSQEFCWLTQEDVIRFLLSSIGLFSTIPMLSVEALGIISHDHPTVDYHSPASSAVGPVSRALLDRTSVAVVDDGGVLIGEISPFALACCDETVAPAVVTLSAGDLMSYMDCGGPPEEISRLVEERLRERGLEGMLEEFVAGTHCGNSSSSDEELPSPTTVLGRKGRWCNSGRMGRRAEAVVCRPWSSLVAVMIQAIAHRVNYVWVVEEDCSLVGIVTFASMLEVFRENLESMI